MQQLETLAIQYFPRLYSLEDVESVVEKLPWGWFAVMSSEDKVELSRPFSELEIETAV